MAVVNAFILIGSFLQVLLPLGLVKLNALRSYFTVFFSKPLSAGNALLKLGIVDLSGDSYRNGCLGHTF